MFQDMRPPVDRFCTTRRMMGVDRTATFHAPLMTTRVRFRFTKHTQSDGCDRTAIVASTPHMGRSGYRQTCVVDQTMRRNPPFNEVYRSGRLAVACSETRACFRIGRRSHPRIDVVSFRGLNDAPRNTNILYLNCSNIPV